MTTDDAILQLQTLSQNLGVQIDTLTLQQQAVDTATSQLQATLVTQLAELTTTTEQLDTAKQQLETSETRLAHANLVLSAIDLDIVKAAQDKVDTPPIPN